MEKHIKCKFDVGGTLARPSTAFGEYYPKNGSAGQVYVQLGHAKPRVLPSHHNAKQVTLFRKKHGYLGALRMPCSDRFFVVNVLSARCPIDEERVPLFATSACASCDVFQERKSAWDATVICIVHFLL